MLVFVSKRIGYMVFTMVAVSLLVFLLLEINVEGVAVGVLGPYSTDEQRNLWLEANGYFRPAYVRYFEWVGRFFTGDMGDSVRFRVPVSDILWVLLLSSELFPSRKELEETLTDAIAKRAPALFGCTLCTQTAHSCHIWYKIVT